MPYQTTWEKKGIFWKYSGIVTDIDIIAPNNEFYADPRSENILYQLVDGTGIEKFKLDEPSLKLLAATDYAAAMSVRKLKVAFVATRVDVVDFFQTYINYAKEFNCEWEFKIFTDLNSARKWISLCYK